jgi:hypothetical protein
VLQYLIVKMMFGCLCRILATPGLRSKLDKLMAAKGGSFEREVAYRASQAAGALMLLLPVQQLWLFVHAYELQTSWLSVPCSLQKHPVSMEVTTQ